MSRLNYSTTTAARSRVVKVWIALRNNPGEKHLTRDVASCGQGDNLIGREMHGEKGKVGLFHNQALLFKAFSVASVRRSIRSWPFETFLA